MFALSLVAPHSLTAAKINRKPSKSLQLIVFFLCTQSILERLDAGEIVIGDGGFVFALEKRGYVKAGPWTPEAAAEHPEAGKSRRVKAIKSTPPTPGKCLMPSCASALQCASCTESS